MRLLIADDEASLRQLLQKVLVSDGWSVKVAADKFTALQTARQWLPHVVLLDLGLPGPPLGEVVQGMADLLPPPAIVVITGHHHPEEVLWPVRGHIRTIVKKPFDLFELRALVRKMHSFPP